MQDNASANMEVHDSIIAALQPNTPFKVYQDMACDMFEKMGHATIRQQYNLSEATPTASDTVWVWIFTKSIQRNDSHRKRHSCDGSVFSIEPGLYYPSRILACALKIRYI
jgi:Xaa-Pro aminopeptidase